jgi:tripartite-type tricarboxylate transporter receptor subunit TctC
MKRTALKAIAAGAMLAASAFSQAAFPDKPIKLVVPFPAGGTTDVVTRVVAAKAAELLGQPIVIENRGGAGGSIGSDVVAKSPADGYTLLVATNSHTANPSIYKKLPYDTQKDFVGVAFIGDTPGIFVVNPSVPVHNVKEFVEYAKKKGDSPIRFGSAGAGTYPHLSAELFMQQAGIKMEHIPYKGAAPALVDLLGGRYEFKVEGATTAWQYVQQGKLRALGMTSKERMPQMPNIPTVAEQGYPEYETNFWMAVMAPAGTPEPARAKLEKAFMDALKDKAVIEKLYSQTVRPRAEPGADADKLIAAELKLWPPIVKAAGMTAN